MSRTLNIRRIAGLVLLAGTGGVAAQTATQPTTQPTAAWKWETSAETAWVRLVGAPGEHAVLVATTDPALHLLNACTGRPMLDEPVAVQPDIRPAEPPAAYTDLPDRTAWCFDRHAVYALRLEAPAELRWRYGPAAGKQPDYPRDPEYAGGWVAAAVSSAGVFALDAGGRLVLLDHADGKVAWSHALPKLATPRLHTSGSRAALLGTAGGRSRAWLVDAGEDPPEVTEFDVEPTWPLWSTLVPDGLVTITLSRATVWPAVGAPRSMSLGSYRFQASAIDVYLPPPPNPTDDPALLIVGGGSRPAAYDLSTGARRWSAPMRAYAGGLVHALNVSGPHVLLTTRRGVHVLEVERGQPHGKFDAGPGRVLDADSWDGQLRVALRAPTSLQAPLRVEVGRLSAGARAVTTHKIPLPRDADPRDFIWLPDRVLLVQPHSIAAYLLP